jgi:hypothetical protein
MRKLAIVTVLLLPVSAFAEEPRPKKPPSVVLQGGGGIVTPGTIYFGDLEASTSVGPYATVAADLLLGAHVSIGAYFVYSDLDELVLKSAGASLKVRFPIGKAVELRLGVGSAYQTGDLYISNTDTVPITGWGVTPFAELGFAPRSKLGLAIQVAGISQPVGGNDDFSATWAPIPTVALLGELRL